MPGPPYHFISRIAEIQGRLGHCEPGLEIVADYDIPDDAWYFDANGAQVMPFAVLLEAALQPCGWVATAVGSTLGEADDQLFRNLDGTGTLSAELTRTADTLRTRVRLTSVSRSGGTTIESFEVQCLLGERPVYRMETVFGFFPPAAFENQVGLPITDEHRRQLAELAQVIRQSQTQYQDVAQRPLGVRHQSETPQRVQGSSRHKAACAGSSNSLDSHLPACGPSHAHRRDAS